MSFFKKSLDKIKEFFVSFDREEIKKSIHSFDYKGTYDLFSRFSKTVLKIFPQPDEDNTEPPVVTEDFMTKPPIKKHVYFFLTVILLFFGGMMLWSFTSELETGTIAVGKISVDTNRKTIQHLEGGIVSKIYVREGDKVNEGAPLVQIDETQSKILLDLLRAQVNILLATESRLIAERENKQSISFPEELIKQSAINKKVKDIIQGQINLFNARNDADKSVQAILKQRISQLNNEAKSLKSQVDSSQRQLDLIREELKAVRYLREKNYIDKPRLLALEREEARLIGNRDENIALIARNRQKVGETELQLIQVADERRKQILEDLHDAEKQLAELVEKQRSAENVLHRSLVTAPLAGTVVGLQVHTIGGVVQPGATLMDIVPTQDTLIIEARIRPNDIDVVHTGLKAKVRLTAYKSRHMPILKGTVTNVSADSFTDEKINESYYIARISIDKDELALIPDVKLYPGMPTEVMIIRDTRTPFQYLTDPLEESFDRAFHEE